MNKSEGRSIAERKDWPPRKIIGWTKPFKFSAAVRQTFRDRGMEAELDKLERQRPIYEDIPINKRFGKCQTLRGSPPSAVST